MPVYKVIERLTGNEVSRYASASVLETVNGASYPLSSYDHVEYIEDAPPPSAPVLITRTAMRNRFTDAERASIEIAMQDDPAAPQADRERAANLRALDKDLLAAEYIDLKSQKVRSAVQYIESLGLIAAGRASQILDTPPAEQELYRG